MQEDTPDDEYMAKFLLLRDGNKPSLMLYSVPLDAFERADEGGAAGGGGGGAGDGGAGWGDAGGGAASGAAAAASAE